MSKAEELRDLERDGRGDREPHGEGGVPMRGGRRGAGARRNDELLPEALGVLAGELARDRIQIAQTLDRDEERFVFVKAGFAQRLDLAAEMVLELLDVDGADGLPPPEILPPFPDALFLQSFFRHPFSSVVGNQPGCTAGSTARRQTPRSAVSTVCH